MDNTIELEKIESTVNRLRKQVAETWKIVKELQNKGYNVYLTFPQDDTMLKPDIRLTKDIYSESDVYKPLLDDFTKNLLSL